MDKSRQIGLTAAAFMACAPGVASAAPHICATNGNICQTTSFTFVNTTQTIPFLGFTAAAAALGITGATLTDVHEELDGSGSVSGTVSNSSAQTVNFSVTLSDMVSKTLPPPIGLLSVTALSVTASTPAVASGGTFSTSASGASTTTASSSGTAISNYLANFTATASDIGGFQATASFLGTVLQTGSVASAVRDVLQYSFSTPSPPPPPPTKPTGGPRAGDAQPARQRFGGYRLGAPPRRRRKQ